VPDQSGEALGNTGIAAGLKMMAGVLLEEVRIKARIDAAKRD
jgi:hypothetical protein